MFLGLQGFAIGLILKTLLEKSIVSSSGTYLMTGVAIIGILASVIWLFVNCQSISYNRAWMTDARNLRNKDEFLLGIIVESFKKTPGLKDKKGGGLQKLKFWTWAVTSWFQILVVGTIIIWLLFIYVVLPKLSLLEGSAKSPINVLAIDDSGAEFDINGVKLKIAADAHPVYKLRVSKEGVREGNSGTGSKSSEQKYILLVNGHELEISGGVLRVIDRSYGIVQPGDKVSIQPDKQVLINGQVRLPSTE